MWFIRLLAHSDEMEPSTSQASTVSNTTSDIGTSSPAVAKSYKCEE